MSGGRWNYDQYRFTDVIDDIKELISKNGQKKSEEELRLEYWNDKEWLENEIINIDDIIIDEIQPFTK